jgi:hypothetical protein
MKPATRFTAPKRAAGTSSRTTSGTALSDNYGQAKKSLERYLELARASERVGDHVATESLYQHAEHYSRLMTSTRQDPTLSSEDVPVR